MIKNNTIRVVFKTCDANIDKWEEIRKKMVVGETVVGR